MRYLMSGILLALFVLWLFACGGEQEVAHSSNRQIEPVSIAGTDEEKAQFLRQINMRIRSDLRTLATSLVAYCVDNNTYPPNLHVLTTPIAYAVQEWLTDPYTGQNEYGYEQRKDIGWILWSIGPDGEDQGGEEVYEESKGLESSGDIIRTKQ